MSNTHILVIYNPSAGGGNSIPIYEKFIAYLDSSNTSFTSYVTAKHDNKIPLLKLVEENNFTLVSILGGDGTINIALNALSGIDVPIHIIPAGTGNDLAKMIYPESYILTDIFSLTASSVPFDIDIWRCNDRLFFNGFGVGFDGEIAHRMYSKRYLLPSKVKYWLELLKLIFFYKSNIITVNGQSRRTFMLATANGSVYGGGFNIAPKAKINDQLLDVILIHDLPIFRRILYLPKIEKGNHLDLNVVTATGEKEVHIQCDSEIPAHLDGEPILSPEYRISSAGKLTLIH